MLASEAEDRKLQVETVALMSNCRGCTEFCVNVS